MEQAYSALYHSNWSKFDGFLADSSSMTGVDNVSDILIGLRSLLHHQLRRRHPHTDSLPCQFVEHLSEVKVPSGLSPTQSTPRAVTGGAKGLLHALFSASKNIAAGAHSAADQHWLSC